MSYEIVSEAARYSKKQIHDTVIKSVEVQLGVKVKNINQKLEDDFGMDSLDSTEIIMDLEEKFNIEIKDETIDAYMTKVGRRLTVKGLIDIVTMVLADSDKNKDRVASKLLKRIR